MKPKDRRYVGERREYRRAHPGLQRVEGAIDHEATLEKNLRDMSQAHEVETQALRSQLAALERENLRLKSEIAVLARLGHR